MIIPEFKMVEGLNKARQEVMKSVNHIKSLGGDTTLHDLNLKLCQAMEEMRHRLETSKECITKISQRFKQRITGQDEKIEGNLIILEYQFEVIRDLLMQGELLEGIALGVSPLLICLSIYTNRDVPSTVRL